MWKFGIICVRLTRTNLFMTLIKPTHYRYNKYTTSFGLQKLNESRIRKAKRFQWLKRRYPHKFPPETKKQKRKKYRRQQRQRFKLKRIKGTFAYKFRKEKKRLLLKSKRFQAPSEHKTILKLSTGVLLYKGRQKNQRYVRNILLKRFIHGVQEERISFYDVRMQSVKGWFILRVLKPLLRRKSMLCFKVRAIFRKGHGFRRAKGKRRL